MNNTSTSRPLLTDGDLEEDASLLKQTLKDPAIASHESMSLDTFLDKIGLKWYHIRYLLVIGSVAVSEGAQIIIMALSVTFTQTEWKFNDVTQSLLITLSFLGVVAGSGTAGYFGDKYGRRAPMLFSLLAMTVFNLISAFSVNIAMFMVFRLLVGLSLGFFAPVGFAAAVENAPKEHRGKIVMLASACMFVGQLVGCLIAGFTADDLTTGNWRALILWSTVPFAISLILNVLYLDESLRYLLVLGRFEESFALIEKILRVNKNQEFRTLSERQKMGLQAWEYHLEEEVDNSDIASIRALFKHDVRRLTMTVWFGWFVNFFVYYGIIIFLPLTLASLSRAGQRSVLDKTVRNDDLMDLAFSVLAESVSVFIAFIMITIKKFSRKKSLIVFLILAGACMLAMTFKLPKALFIILATLAKIINNVCSYYYYLFTLESYPTKYRATGLGVALAFGKIATVLMPFTCFGLTRIYSLGPFALFAVLCFAASFSIIKLPQDMEEKEIR